MPWRECNVMGERVKFVARFLEGELRAATVFKMKSRYAGSLPCRNPPRGRASRLRVSRYINDFLNTASWSGAIRTIWVSSG